MHQFNNLTFYLQFSSVQFSSVTQSCPTLCDPMNCSTPSLPVHHQLPEFTQTHVHRVGDAIQLSHPLSSSPSPTVPSPFQNQGLFQWVYLNEEQIKPMCVLCRCSHVWLFATQWTVVRQAPLSMRFYRQEYWSGLPCPAPEDLPDSGTNLHLSCHLHWLAVLEPPGKPKLNLKAASYEIIKIKQ